MKTELKLSSENPQWTRGKRPKTIMDFQPPPNPTTLAKPDCVSCYEAKMAAKRALQHVLNAGQTPTGKNALGKALHAYKQELARRNSTHTGHISEPELMRQLAEAVVREPHQKAARKAATDAAMHVFEHASGSEDGRELRAKAQQIAIIAATSIFRQRGCPGAEVGGADCAASISYDTLAHRTGKVITGDNIKPVQIGPDTERRASA